MTPEGWRSASLGSDIELLSGQHLVASEWNDRGMGTPYLTGPADFPDGRIAASKYTERPKTLCNAGDILITVKGAGTGKLAISDGRYCISRQLMAVRPSKWDRSFVYYALCGQADQLQRDSAGLIPGLSRTQILAIPILAPPLPEQRKIAAILSSVDEVIEKTEAVIEQLQVVKKAMIQELLTRGMPGRHSRFKQTEIGVIPEEWEVLSIPSFCRPRQWPTISKSDLLHEGFPVYGANGQIGYYNKYNHASPAIAITCRGATCGTVNVIPAQAYITGNAMALDDLDTDKVAFDFLHHALRHRGFTDVISGSAQPQITGAGLQTARIGVPCLAEQTEIARALDAVDGRIAAEQRSHRELNSVKEALMAVLLTGEVRVKPDEEAA